MPESPPRPPTPPLPQAPRRRAIISSRACDRCRRRKAKCDSTGPGRVCTLCQEADEDCTFDLPLARRGPKTRKRAENGLPVPPTPVSSGLSSLSNGAGANGSGTIASTNNSNGNPFSGASSSAGLAFVSPTTSPTASWDQGPAPSLGLDAAVAGLSPHPVRSSISDPVVISAFQRWHTLSRSLGLMNVSIEHMITRCFDLFFEYLYPLTPLVHEPSLRDGLVFFLTQAHTSLETDPAASVPMPDTWSDFPPTNTTSIRRGLLDPWHDSAFTLITAVCAEAAFLLPKDLFAEGESVADIFLQASRSCLNNYLEADLENPNANSIAIRYFHSNCLHAAGKPKYSWHIFGEATRLAQVMHLHEETSFERLHPIEAELRRRAFWIVYMGDKSAAILNNRPITIHKFSFEEGITTKYPTGIEDDSSVSTSPRTQGGSSDSGRPSFIEGFNANLRLWQAASDLLLEIRVRPHDETADMGSGSIAPNQFTAEHRQRIDALYVRFITCLDNLPPYLQSYTFAASIAGGGGDQETTQSNQFVIQCANLQVSLHCLRMVVTQKFDNLSYWGFGAEQADLRKSEIARDMLRVMHEAPFWSLQVNGEPYVEKIRLIGASLLAIIHHHENSPLATRAKADFVVLLDILTRLDSKASDALRSTTTWDVYPSKA